MKKLLKILIISTLAHWQISTLILSIVYCLLVIGCSREADIQEEAQQFIDQYSKTFQKLSYDSELAQWQSNIRIVEGDSTNAIATRKTSELFAKFTGSEENINQTRAFLENKEHLTPLLAKQLEAILYRAANNPATIEAVVKKRIKAETEQTEKLFGFDFQIEGKSVSTNEIDEILSTESNLDKRLKTWTASKEVGIILKEGLNDLRNLRNETVKTLGYNDYFTYQVFDYGLSSDELREMMHQLVEEIWPLYRELHTYARYDLAEIYGASSVPDMLPAHWLPNRWGQDWSAIVEGFDFDNALKEKSAEWLVQQGELFYESIGFPGLPQSFWEKSNMYPLASDAGYKKNNHASAWHLNLENDVRCLMSVIPNSSWYETVHHELGHIYYFMTYTNDDVPMLLREGANRAYHEAIGSLMGLAAMQRPFLEHRNLVSSAARIDELAVLLKEALSYIIFIPWSAGVMTEFEYELYANDLPIDQFNKRWWELKAKYQGIVPPYDRGEEYCDAASKTHINNDAAQYYDYAISFVLLFQLHDHIAKNILKQNPHATNYYGNKAVGDFIKQIMYPGASVDWRELLKEKTGSPLSARAMVEYFSPLMSYLKKINKGRKYTLPKDFE